MKIDHTQTESWQTRFIRNWLFEMPQHTDRSDDRFDYLERILDRELWSKTPIPMGSDRFRVNTSDGEMFWQERNGDPVIILDTTPFGGGYAVTLVGKKKGDPVDATDFYLAVRRQTRRLIFSGDQISDQGLALWQKLVTKGSVDVYNVDTAEEIPINSIDDIVDPKYNDSDIRFVLSEDNNERLAFQHAFSLLEAISLCHGLTRNEILRRPLNV